MPKSKSYQPKLLEALRDPEEAAEYLNAALEEGDKELFLLALRNVADARGGLSKLAEATDLNRENLYRMLSERGNPEFYSLNALLHALGFRLAVELKTDEAKSEGEEERILVLHTRKVAVPTPGNELSLAANSERQVVEKTMVLDSKEKEIGTLKNNFVRGELYLEIMEKLPNWPNIDVEVHTKNGGKYNATTTTGTGSKLVLLQKTPVRQEDVEKITLKPHADGN